MAPKIAIISGTQSGLGVSRPLRSVLNLSFPAGGSHSGLGNGVGTGSSTARLFALDGYRVALISRPRKEIAALKQEIEAAGGIVRLTDHQQLLAHRTRCLTDLYGRPTYFLSISTTTARSSLRLTRSGLFGQTAGFRLLAGTRAVSVSL